MIVCLLRCHNEFCSCPGAGQAGSTSLNARNCATRVCCGGLLVEAGCAVVKGWLMRGRVAESPPARRCALPRPNAEARRRRLMVRPLADDTASERTSQHKRLTLQKLGFLTIAGPRDRSKPAKMGPRGRLRPDTVWPSPGRLVRYGRGHAPPRPRAAAATSLDRGSDVRRSGRAEHR